MISEVRSIEEFPEVKHIKEVKVVVTNEYGAPLYVELHDKIYIPVFSLRNFKYLSMYCHSKNVKLRVQVTKLRIHRGLYYTHDFVIAYRNLFRSRRRKDKVTDENNFKFVPNMLTGGGRLNEKTIKKRTWSKSELSLYTTDLLPDIQYEFVDYVSRTTDTKLDLVYIDIPKEILLTRLNAKQLDHVCNKHGIHTKIKRYVSLTDLQNLFQEHDCELHAC